MTNEDRFRELLKRLTVDLRGARSRIEELEDAAHAPIAIVGMGCRYPGGVDSPEGLWRVVAEGRETLGPFPTDRAWDLDRLFSDDPDAPGTSYVTRAGFLEGAGRFDAAFFGISPREALAMDPQQRVSLEVAWEAVERAGIDPRTLNGTQTGVFLGLVGQGYGPRIQDAEEGLDAYLPTGTMPAVAAGRIAYTLGLSGPAVPVDTSCSSSLVALHLAARSLRSGESSLALAGGAMIFADPGAWISFSRQRALSFDGRCKAFGAGADGTGWAEGVGVLVLETLSEALRHGRPVHAVLRGSAVNSDGASSGLTAPNGTAQRQVIRHALRDARLRPADVDAVEAHGTGTALGDPIEAGALLATYGRDREEAPALKLGSVKSNIGHTGPAAGIAGIIKMVEGMRRGLLPRTLHAEEPNPHVDWESGAVEVLSEPAPWHTPQGRPRRAAVSAFGVSGTNAHVIIEQHAPAPEREAATPPAPGGGPVPWVLSAASEAALRAQALRLAEHAEGDAEARPADIGWSLAATRTRFEHRAALVAADREDFAASLRAFADGKAAPGVVRASAAPQGRTAFVFPGQGAQWPGMARRLLEESPVFAERMRACAAALDPHLRRPLLDALHAQDDASVERADVAQPVMFAVMVSLAALWTHHGIAPAAVVGHSQGEIAAAHVAGVLSLEDAARVIAVRSRLVAPLAAGGAMLALAVPPGRAVPPLEEWGGALEVSAHNGPGSVVVSGEEAALQELASRCASEGVFAFRVPGSFAAHSPRVDPVREPLLDELAGIAPGPGGIPLYSTVTGARAEGARLDAEHWFRNVRGRVLFQDAVAAMAEAGCSTFVEVGPHPVLTVGIEQTLEQALGAGARDTTVLGTLRSGEGGLDRFLTALAEAHVRGAEPDWRRVFADHAPRTVELPTYPFQGRHYWLGQQGGTRLDAAGLHTEHHPFLGASVSLPDGGHLLTGRLSRAGQPWLADHAVLDTPLLPGTAFLEIALHAGAQAGCTAVEELLVHAPLEIPPSGGAQLQVSVAAPDSSGNRAVEVHSRPWSEAPGDDRPWLHHATGMLCPAADEPPEQHPAPWPPAGAEPLAADDLYAVLAERGYGYGPAFQGVQAAWRHGEDVYADVRLAPDLHSDAERFSIHPALLDAAQHALALGTPEGPGGAPLALPFAWTGVSLHSAGGHTALRVRLRPSGEGTALSITDPSGAPVADVACLTLRPTDAGRLAATSRSRDDLYRPTWIALPRAEAPTDPGEAWAVLGSDPLGLRATLVAAGHKVDAYSDLAALRSAVASGAPRPGIVLASCVPLGADDTPEAARAATHEGLELIQRWLADEGEQDTRLVLLTWGAVAALPAEEITDAARAPLWGLIRTAQLEAPDRLVAVDIDDPRTAIPALPHALAGDEPQLAVRGGKAHALRLERAAAQAAPPPEWRDDGTVLITGATGTLGALVARHLVQRRGARNLLLLSRSGPDAPGAAELAEELQALGARTDIVACDIADREALASALAGIAPDRPLRAVVHIAGTLDDGVLGALTPARVDHVMRPKADAAHHLHALTRGADLDAFVLFSSAAGLFGSPGQANYSAASAALEALAVQRRAHGLPATAISWGMWERRSTLTAKLDEADLNRFARMGAGPPLSAEHGLALLDAAEAGGEPHVAALPLDLAALAARGARTGTVPPLLRSLVRPPRRARTAGGAEAAELRGELSGRPPAQRASMLTELVRAHTAEVLGHADAGAVGAEDAFLELGYDSLTAVELRNHLSAATGLRLPAGLIFQHTTPAAVAAHLAEELPDATRPAARHAPSAAPDAAGSGDLPALFRECCRQGKIAEGFRLVEAAAQVRPTFATARQAGLDHGAVRLAHGAGGRPMLLCLPSILMISGVQEYARFAAGVRGLRDVEVLAHPGFSEGEPLPGSLDALVDLHADAAVDCAGGRPFVVVARSSGAWVGHAVVDRLERRGATPLALALLDPPYPTDDAALPLIETGLVEREQQLGIVDATRLTAMGGYMRLFQGWLPEPVAAPTLILRPQQATTDREGRALPQFTWDPPHEVLAVPGDHFSMLEGHVDQVARTLHERLAEQGR